MLKKPYHFFKLYRNIRYILSSVLYNEQNVSYFEMFWVIRYFDYKNSDIVNLKNRFWFSCFLWLYLLSSVATQTRSWAKELSKHEADTPPPGTYWSPPPPPPPGTYWSACTLHELRRWEPSSFKDIFWFT